MITLLSPAKTLDFDSTLPDWQATEPEFVNESHQLIKKLRSLSKKKVSQLMNLSNDLTELNAMRYQEWEPEFNPTESKPAVMAFSGEVYRGLDAASFSHEDHEFAQEHLRILSGLHGLLRPLDRIRPYRLEMGTSLSIRKNKNLYQFWSDKITDALNEAMNNSQTNFILNLASIEYSKAVDFSKINGQVITPVFKDFKSGEYKVIMTWAKQARGSMANYVIKNKIMDPQKIKLFDKYQYMDSMSKDNEWVFVREGE
ncbi:MAG: peroxide stress protein YaaA [Salibacteraceae bacterium]